MSVPSGDQIGLNASPVVRRTGVPPSREILNIPGPAASLPATTSHALSGDHSALPCPPEPCTSIDGARLRALVPSAVITEARSFPSCLMRMATLLPSGDTAAGSVSGLPSGFQISALSPFLDRHRPSPAPRSDR